MSSSNNTEERFCTIAWSHLGVIGPRTAGQLRQCCGSLAAAWKADGSTLERCGLGKKTLAYVLEKRRQINPEQCVSDLEGLGITALCLTDPAYPELLRQSPGAPYVLYVKGTLAGAPHLAIVGTRSMSRYGKQITEKLTEELVQAGIVIVSGLALGIDATAHASCLRSGGKTIAVFGSGVDAVYPAANYHLAEKILAQGGAWVSEFPPGTTVQARNFPQRNRIIAGLSLGTLVIEAGEKSGALITARAALEANREVFVVPGTITSPQSIGSNLLMQQGATPVLTSKDITEALHLAAPRSFELSKEPITLSREEAEILGCFRTEALHLDQLIAESRMPSQRVLTLCAQLELKGCIKAIGDGQYILQR